MSAHQRQAEPQFVVPSQGRNGATDLRGLQIIESRKVLQDLHEGEKCFPMAVRPVMQHLLTLGNLHLQIFHATAMLLELLAIAPAMGRMLLEIGFQILDGLGLRQHFTRQVVLRGGHVVPLSHMPHGQCQTAALLVTMTQLAGTAQLRGLDTFHLKAAEFGVQAHHGLTGHQQPDVVEGETEQQRKLTGPLTFLDDHRRCDAASELG